jgi:CRISPR/Cas system-associated exonuclease Cas4 (RecB family)
MQPFLHQTTTDLYQRYGSDLGNIRIVFPNRRSILYFRKYLSEIVDKPVWSPECVTISNFIQQFSKLRKTNELILLYELFKAYRDVRKSEETFDNFYYWGSLMLSDFDDIDKYLVDAQNLFQNLSALKNINELFTYLNKEQIEAIQVFWKDFSESRKSNHHNEFSNLWSTMNAIYLAFRTNLREKNIAYEGMIYRDVADDIANNLFSDNEYLKTAFVGFNALSKCEKAVFKYYGQADKALFYWDYNMEFVENKIHEAGFFIRKNLEEFPSALNAEIYENNIATTKYELISVPSVVGQAKILEQLISESNEIGEQLEKTAILLTDESLLMPVLHSIPGSIEEINITMGFPFENSPIYSLIESVCRLHSQASTIEKNDKFFYKNILEILSHPYIYHTDETAVRAFMQLILRNNKIYLSSAELAFNDLFARVFCNCKSVRQLIEIIEHLVLKTSSFVGENKIAELEQPVGVEQEAFICVTSVLNQLATVFADIDLELSISLGASIITKTLKEQKIAFEGEPLKGIQVMGFLESRALDFENVFILGVNEGKLPKTNIPASFIPYNLRYGFGLPTLEYRDAMYAYYFYRIINRAKHVYLIYSTVAETTGSNEMSRYAIQLLYDDRYHIQRKTQVFQVNPSEIRPIKVDKNEKILEKLYLYTKADSNKYISPSALTTYMDCSLRFYYRYIAGLKKPDTTLEAIDAPMLGTILHQAMYRLYKPFEEQILSKELLNQTLQDDKLVEREINRAIASEFLKDIKNPDDFIPEGLNLIVARIVFKYVKRIIAVDIDHSPIHIKSLEQKVRYELKCTVNGKLCKIQLGGVIDRIDETSEGIRIIDYKTGELKTDFKSMEELFPEQDKLQQKKEIFQTLLYSILYKHSTSNIDKVLPGIYNVRKIFDDDFDYKILIDKEPVTDLSALENEFVMLLESLLSKIFNPAIPFEQTSDKKKCNYCDYRELCMV